MDQKATDVAQEATHESKLRGEATRDPDGENKPEQIRLSKQKNNVHEQKVIDFMF